jgi:hypothetical protein
MKVRTVIRLCRLRKRAAMAISDPSSLLKQDRPVALKAIGLASVGVGAVALGLYVGRELRSRYKFKRRTPYERFSHSGDESLAGGFGMGV